MKIAYYGCRRLFQFCTHRTDKLLNPPILNKTNGVDFKQINELDTEMMNNLETKMTNDKNANGPSDSLNLVDNNRESVRLSKWISRKSICSRRQAEDIIKLGLVRINGKRVFENQLVPLQSDIRAYTNIGVQTSQPITKLWMLNKPRGVICSHRDPSNRPTVYNLLPPHFKVYGHLMSVGRLDYNSEGLLLLTNDATLKHLLENPDADLERYYRVKVHGRVTEDKLHKMHKSMLINGQSYGPLRVQVDRELSTNVWMDVWMKTGKNRQIRRIMQKCDLEVNKLIRKGYGPYALNKLQLRDVKELPISRNLDRKLKKTKAMQISQKANCLIELDVRPQAIQYAQQSLRNQVRNNQQKVDSEKNLEISGKEKSAQKTDKQTDETNDL